MAEKEQSYLEASVKTADDLRSIARSMSLREVSQLTLPEIDNVVERIAAVIPAGNVPGVILSGLARLSGRRPPLREIRRDIDLLFQGVEQMLDQAVYGALFAGPAAVIWGYQNLLKLAGIEPDAAFPEGTWQFYVDYALREDTARHANETHGFATALDQHDIHLSRTQRLTAWVMACIHALHDYPALLANEWRERMYTRLLVETARDLELDTDLSALYGQWLRQRPYTRTADTAAAEPYHAYRWRQFATFLDDTLSNQPEKLRKAWSVRVREAEAARLGPYQMQMSILGYLKPEKHNEVRVPIPIEKAHIGVIVGGHYHLIPVGPPADVTTVAAQVQHILDQPTEDATSLMALARVERAEAARLRDQFSPAFAAELDHLRFAPILINADGPRHTQTLSAMRYTERGIGSHALTLIDAGERMVFDQSHIYFDGAWGAALAEILTNEALSWAAYLHQTPPATVPEVTPPQRLSLPLTVDDRKLIEATRRTMTEASAETPAIDLQGILAVRKRLKKRNERVNLTVNDLLILYRAIHAVSYRPPDDLLATIDALTDDRARGAARRVVQPETRKVPSTLIPVDASPSSPGERLYPVTLDVPLADLDLLAQHEQVLASLEAYESAEDKAAAYATFDEHLRAYLTVLAGFATLMDRIKQVALEGKSSSVETIKLLAHMPAPLQRLLDDIPNQFDLINDIIKGNEVFSNVGAVAPTSTLTRFISAKDDNHKKTLIWGVMSDASGTMVLTLRDFREHVQWLPPDLARRITQDYVDAYATGLNTYISDLRRITGVKRPEKETSP